MEPRCVKALFATDQIWIELSFVDTRGQVVYSGVDKLSMIDGFEGYVAISVA